MINPPTYSLDWITQRVRELPHAADPKLLEKVIYAFTLLEQLCGTGLPFVFKGGTALLLLAGDNPQRFSIDIDIITELPADQLPEFLDRIIEKGIFLRYIADNDRKSASGVPVGHYKFYYRSALEKEGEEPVMLDVLFSAVAYPQLVSCNLIHPWLSTSGECPTIRIPATASLAGDKLTAMAPNTIGILYAKQRPTEIMKQLFDLGVLFDSISDINEVRQSYIRVATEEIGYRKLGISWEEALQDTFDTCCVLTRREEADERFQQLLKGFKNFYPFLLRKYFLEDAILSAAKTAYLARLVGREAVVKEVYTGPDQIKDLTITQDGYGKMQRLKKTYPEAFFYWYQALMLA